MRRREGTQRRAATLLTAPTEVRGKALEKRCRWNWLNWLNWLKQSSLARSGRSLHIPGLLSTVETQRPEAT